MSATRDQADWALCAATTKLRRTLEQCVPCAVRASVKKCGVQVLSSLHRHSDEVERGYEA
jgi:hypothetical protein